MQCRVVLPARGGGADDMYRRWELLEWWSPLATRRCRAAVPLRARADDSASFLYPTPTHAVHVMCIGCARLWSTHRRLVAAGLHRALPSRPHKPRAA